MTTATTPANPNLAFFKYWGIQKCLLAAVRKSSAYSFLHCAYIESKTPLLARSDSISFCVRLIRKTDKVHAAKVGRSCTCNPATKRQWEHRYSGKTTNGS